MAVMLEFARAIGKKVCPLVLCQITLVILKFQVLKKSLIVGALCIWQKAQLRPILRKPLPARTHVTSQDVA